MSELRAHYPILYGVESVRVMHCRGLLSKITILLESPMTDRHDRTTPLLRYRHVDLEQEWTQGAGAMPSPLEP